MRTFTRAALLVAVVGAVSSARGAVAQGREVSAGPMLHSECIACHPRAHDIVARDADAPATCVECHTDSTFVPRGRDVLAAVDRACTSCHGTRFAGLVIRWNSGLLWRREVVARFVAAAKADQRLARSSTAASRVRAAEEAVNEVTTARGVHNVAGADALLRVAVDSGMAAYRAARLPAPAAPRLGPDPARVSCLGCHYGIETNRGAIVGRTFDHATHVVRADVSCITCHSRAAFFVHDTHDRDPNHGQTTLAPSACEACHHAANHVVSCQACHASDIRLAHRIRSSVECSIMRCTCRARGCRAPRVTAPA